MTKEKKDGESEEKKESEKPQDILIRGEITNELVNRVHATLNQFANELLEKGITITIPEISHSLSTIVFNLGITNEAMRRIEAIKLREGFRPGTGGG